MKKRVTAYPKNTGVGRVTPKLNGPLMNEHDERGLLSSGSRVRIAPGTPSSCGQPLPDKNSRFFHGLSPKDPLSCQCEELEMTTLGQALTAYTFCARSEGRSPRTIEWITRSIDMYRVL